MTRFDAAPRAPRQIDYLDAVAATPGGRDYKRRMLAALDIRPGHAVLDVGCGPGTDLGHLAAAAGPDGSVIGVDANPDMVAEAHRRTAHLSTVEVRPGDAHHLPLSDGCVDRARFDRVLQHLADPARALAELRRVVRPGGVVAMAEPDWDTLAVDDGGTGVSREFTRFVAGRVRNPVIGRQLARLAGTAGFRVASVDATAVMLRHLDDAETVLGLHRNAVRAVQAGALAAGDARRWLDSLGDGPLVAAFMFFTVTATG